MSKVSIIIPCYNQGQYIDEAVDSVLNQTFQNFEIIVINDGSTDKYTNKLLLEINRPRTKIYNIKNGGLAKARNYGILKSTGKYILPLDADDKISPFYLEKAIEAFDNDDIKLVYSKAVFFGNREGQWNLATYSYEKLLYQNMIFCSAIYKKSDFLKTNGYNPNMIFGWEDWDLWLSLLDENSKVICLDEVHFYYRVKKKSMIINITKEQELFLYEQLYKNHKLIYDKFLEPIIYLKKEKENNKAGFKKYKDLYNKIKKSNSYQIGNKLIKFLDFRKWL